MLRMHAKKRSRKRIVFIVRALVLFISIGLLVSGATILTIASTPTPDLSSFAGRKVTQTTKIYDRTGEVLLYNLHDDVQRRVVPLSDISRHIRNATVAIEDDTFYEHPGVRITSFFRAILVNTVSGQYAQGGSTITQQVVKNSILTPEKTITRKIREWVLALKLEQAYSKDEILNFYLNESPYGGNIYGIEEASILFFGKPSKDVSIAEAAYLAALPQAPTYFSPYGNHRTALDARKNLVLSRMHELGFISEEEHREAKEEEVVFSTAKRSSIIAPHFVFYVRDYLESKYGRRAIEESGLRVITSLDVDLQKKAEDIVYRYAIQNETNFNAENASLVAIDPTNGGILVMVGSRDYFDTEIDGAYNISTALRQPGSAFKPFVYAKALEQGYTRDTIVFDLKTQFSTACSPTSFSETPPCYSPNNYDGVFRGPVTLKEALAQSLNIPAVKFLYLVGIQPALDMARSLGITTLTNPAQYGLTLVLGGGEVRLLEMVSAYGVFAADGVRHNPVSVLRVEDSSGKVLEEYVPQGRNVLNPTVARDISDILSDNVVRTPAFGSNSALHFPGYDVAVKTGTTNDYRDAWIVGYTPFISVGAWAGNNDNSPMERRVAGFIIAPLWNEFMAYALSQHEKSYFPEPSVIPSDIPLMLRGVWGIPNEYGVVEPHSILHFVQKNSPRSGAPTNPGTDPQYAYWEYPIALWRSTSGMFGLPENIGGEQ